MPVTIDPSELTMPPNNRKTKYPWDEWFTLLQDGWVLKFADDEYDIPQESFRMTLYQAAVRRDIAVWTSIREDGVYIGLRDE